ncbi:hypothetical protein [Sphingopyxis sp. BSNA05]|uniref:hypothetical protein n=1 Tax=Sphingopyxis sp. BSNA05 TaxID=1236614 RepID=UPI0020B8D0AE|nr:hypothetical protein [Sphingopyxis sp. BSNA05]
MDHRVGDRQRPAQLSRYHLTHHRFTQQSEDPDLGLSAAFPTTPASMKRKVIRDLTGQTFFKQRSNQFVVAWKGLKAMLTPFVLSLSKDEDARRAYFDKLSTNGNGNATPPPEPRSIATEPLAWLRPWSIWRVQSAPHGRSDASC